MQKRSSKNSAVLPGTLDMLILKTLCLGPLHGYGIAQHIQQVSKDAFKVEEGSLYPALQRLELKGLVRSEWEITPNKREVRNYQITGAGKRQLSVEESAFESMVEAIRRVLRTV
jgi:PadR family transcriptional regulator, regulatory protein PadR